jgi:predicted DsbA family dithiol-disulfide isomerase
VKQGENKRIEGMVNDFLVWRAASSVNWDCTIGDLAEETGLSLQTVSNVLRRKGWRDRVNDDPYRHVDRLPVDHAMSNTHANILGRF